MKISSLSKRYEVKRIQEIDIPAVFKLCQGNQMYYQYCPPEVSIENIKDDLKALPPHKTLEDKYYVGFFAKDQLIAVMDLILAYPDQETVFIGFFMMNHLYQKKNIGSDIISECLQYLKEEGFTKARLGYVKGNPQAKTFWEKNQFCFTGIEAEQPDYTVEVMERRL